MHHKKITLKNGLRFILVPRPKSLSATVLILVSAGSEYESKNTNGISHFLEHMTFKGTVRRPRAGQIAEELAALGAQSNAFTAQEITGYWAKSESRKLPEILDIVSDLYLNPIFNPDEIEKERGVIIEEINMYEDTPARRVQEIFTSLLYGDQPAGWDIAGKKEIIRKLKRKDFVAYRDKHYIAPETLVVVAGSFNERKVIQKIKDDFGGLRRLAKSAKPKVKEKQSRPETLFKFKESDQTHLVLGARAFDMFDGRRYALQVLADILGGGMSSRLFKRIREELGAAYYVRSSADLYFDYGYLSVAAGIDHAKINEVIGVILEEFRHLKNESVQSAELQRSKDHIVGNLILGLETSDELAGFYGEQEILAGKILSPDEIVAKIYSVESKEVKNVAGDIFNNKGLNLAVIGPYKKDAPFKKILKL